MKNSLIILALLFCIVRLFAKDTLNFNDRVKIEIAQNKIENLQKQLDDYKQHTKELNDLSKDEIIKIMQEKEDALDSRMVIYVSVFIAAFVLVFGFFRWLGKSEIRRIVHDQAVKQLDEQLSIKLSEKIIDEKLTELGKPIIERMLKEISESKLLAQMNIDELEASNKKYKELLEELSSKSKNSDSTESIDKAKVKEFTEVLDKVKSEDEFTSEDWFLKGQEAYGMSDFKEAVECYTNSIKLDDKSAEAFFAFYYRALSNYRLELVEEAFKDINSAINIEAKDYSYFVLALIYQKMKDLKNALNSIEKAIEINPDYIQAISFKDEIMSKMNSI